MRKRTMLMYNALLAYIGILALLNIFIYEANMYYSLLLLGIALCGRLSEEDGKDILKKRSRGKRYRYDPLYDYTTVEEPLEFFHIPGRSLLMYIALVGEIGMMYIYNIQI